MFTVCCALLPFHCRFYSMGNDFSITKFLPFIKYIFIMGIENLQCFFLYLFFKNMNQVSIISRIIGMFLLAETLLNFLSNSQLITFKKHTIFFFLSVMKSTLILMDNLSNHEHNEICKTLMCSTYTVYSV